MIAGLTRYVNAGHIARAALEATAFQSREVVEAMDEDSASKLESLKVDGGMVGNDLLMQFQADLLGVPVDPPEGGRDHRARRRLRRRAGRSGFWEQPGGPARELAARTSAGSRTMDAAKRDEYYRFWKKAVTRTFDWFEAE